MDRTAEVRWFAPGPPPDPLGQRMDDLGAKGPERRTDAYLHLPETEALGVKLRDGGTALELKLREQAIGETEFPGGSVGSPELWQKWSFPVVDQEARSITGLGLPARSWLAVDKSRRLATYPDCSAELTELRAAGEEWWTLGFEATEARLMEALTAAAGDFFSESALVEEVRGARSWAYPAWLRTLSRR